MKKVVFISIAVVLAAAAVAFVSCGKPGAQAQEEKPAPLEPEKPALPEKDKPTPPEPEKPVPPKAAKQAAPVCKSFFDNSLHATGEGMRYWYEEEGGFMALTGIPYSKLGCNSCHADSCDHCHKVEKDGVPTFSVKKSRDEKTCLHCHARTKATRMFDEKMNVKDVHSEAGLTCINCHSATDIHGDGTKYKSMRDPGAVNASCTMGECHNNLDTTKRYHKVHKKAKIHCNACHVSSTVSCLNCHLDSFLREKKKEGNFHPAKSWTLLVNHEGWVTTGNAQTLVSEGKKFVAYAPYFTHSVVKEGRKCTDCHGTEAAKKIAAGEPVEMATFAGGKLTHFSGVVPLVPELLKWPWLQKDENGVWSEVKNEEVPFIQKAANAKPFTESQLKKLKAPFKK